MLTNTVTGDFKQLPKTQHNFLRNFGFFTDAMATSDLETLKNPSAMGCDFSTFVNDFEKHFDCYLHFASSQVLLKLGDYEHATKTEIYIAARNNSAATIAYIREALETYITNLNQGAKFVSIGTISEEISEKIAGAEQQSFFQFIKETTGVQISRDGLCKFRFMLQMGAGNSNLNSFPKNSSALVWAEQLLRAQAAFIARKLRRSQKWCLGGNFRLQHLKKSREDAGNAGSAKNALERAISSCATNVTTVAGKLKLHPAAACHAMMILHSVYSVQDDATSKSFKVNEVALTTLFIANKCQRASKWKSLDVVVELWCQQLFPDAPFNLDSEEVSEFGFFFHFHFSFIFS